MPHQRQTVQVHPLAGLIVVFVFAFVATLGALAAIGFVHAL